jgi:glycerol-3-phosphate O-acyltransferase
MNAGNGAAATGERWILSTATTAVERTLIRRWVEEQGDGRGAREQGDRPGEQGDGPGPAPGEQGGGAGAATPYPVIELRDDELVRWLQALAAGEDPLLVPVGISWLPKERDGRREAGWLDVLRLRDPRRPDRFSQGLIAGRHADRYRVVVGEAARVSQLRRRLTRRTGPAEMAGPAGAGELGAFIARQATLALERAERAVIGERYKVPRLVVEEIVTGARHRERVAELAERLGRPRAEVAERARDALDHLVAVQSRLAVDLFGTALRPLHARAWTVRSRAAELERLRELNRRAALVFLPSHRSYADTLVLAEVLHDADFPRNLVVAGDNLSLWPFTALARRAGLVFIRRSFRDDEVYKLAVQEYLGYLVAKRFNLEFYFEGGRSRTGKLRPPRLGLLAYVAAAVRADPAVDVRLVPVSITYERLAEVTSMADEQRGVPKRREGLGWLARYARAQRQAAGDAVVRFGEPIDLRERLTALNAPTSSPGEEPASTPEYRLALSKVAFEVAVGINRATPVLAPSVLALALLGVRDRALTLAQVSRLLRPVLDYVRARSLPESGTAALRDPGALADALGALVRGGVVDVYTGGDEPVYSITPGRHLVAAFYRNNSLHWFVNRAVVELAMIEVAIGAGGAGPDKASRTGPRTGPDDVLGRAWAWALALRDLLKYEFFFPDKSVFRQELLAELELIDPDWQHHAQSVDDVRAVLGSTGFLVAHRVFASFVEAELVVAERLLARPADRPIAGRAQEKEFLASCAGLGHQMLLQGRVHSAEALSGELFASALRLADGRGLLTDTAGRAGFAAEIRRVADRIQVAADIDAGLL